VLNADMPGRSPAGANPWKGHRRFMIGP
jgi:hypothetical protein